MNSVEPTGVLGQFGLANEPRAERKGQTLGQDDFFELMIAQIQNQDPTQPLDSAQYVSQLAEFSSVRGIHELNGTLVDIRQSLHSLHALQASSLVGRTVVLDSGKEATVQSVTIGAGGQGMVLNLANGNNIQLDEIEKIL